jgi:HEAT repeat protein
VKKYLLAFALFLAAGVSPFAQNAQAWVGVRIGIGVPLYVGPGPYYYGYPYYYYPPPAYVAPPAVVYQTAPSPATVVVRSPGEAVAAPTPPPPIASTTPPPPPLPPVTNVIPVSNQTTPQINSLVQQLADASDTVRRDAAVELGRQKAQNAVDALMNMLAKDTSPIAREGAARSLGLIAAPRSLNALIFAAQADNDREVRHSAQFAVEVIRSNLRGN